MVELAKIVGQIFVLVVAAVLGAHYALSKTKRERLWADCYEALRQVVRSLHSIQHHYEAAYLSSMGARPLQGKEATLLEEAATTALVEVRTSLSLALLFTKEELRTLHERQMGLAS